MNVLILYCCYVVFSCVIISRLCLHNFFCVTKSNWFFIPNYEQCQYQDWHQYLQLPTSIDVKKKKNAINSKLGYSTAYLISPDNRTLAELLSNILFALIGSLFILRVHFCIYIYIYGSTLLRLVGFYKIDLNAKLLRICV